jgi:type II secretory pathway pseudopilin PulG
MTLLAAIVVIAALLVVLSAGMGAGVITSERAKRLVFAAIIALAALSGVFQYCQQRRTELTLTGDPRNPPFFDVVDIEDTRGSGVLVNPSDYPAYGVTASLRHLQNLNPGPASFTDPKDIAPHGMVSVFPVTWLENRSPEDFHIRIYARSGEYREELMLRWLTTGRWVRALRVLETGTERVDPDFPRNTHGQIDWPKQTHASQKRSERGGQVSAIKITLLIGGAFFEFAGIVMLAFPDYWPWLRRKGATLLDQVRRVIGWPRNTDLMPGTGSLEITARGALVSTPPDDWTIERKVEFLVKRDLEAQQNFNKLVERIQDNEKEASRRLDAARHEIEERFNRALHAALESYRRLRIAGAVALLVGLFAVTWANFIS